MRKHAKLRAAVIGCGAISDIYLTNLKTRFSTVEVVCCCALHPEHASAKAAQYGIESRTYQQILEDDSIQLILLLTPASTHYALIREALLAGKHVYTEKTMSTSLEEAEELLALARRNGLYLGSAPDTFLGAVLQDARCAIDSGAIGQVTGFCVYANRNLDALAPLLCDKYSERCMFCTDDKHPSDLLEKGHIDYIAREAINKYGVDPIIAVKAACHHASRYFLLNNRGAIAPGYLADFAVIDNFKDFNVEMVFKKGVLYWNNGELRDFDAPQIEEYLDKRAHDTFHVATLTPDDFRDTRQRGVLGMVPGEIVTTDAGYADKIDLENDILKIAVIERHKNTHHIGIGYIKGYGLKRGAVATSISHDSHNIIVVGTNEEDIAAAANRVVELGGGIVVLDHGEVLGEVRLQIAGIMSEEPLVDVNRELENAKEKAFALGVSRGVDPFMTLSFMALPVIPTLRLTTRGVFDTVTQKYV